MNLKFTLILSSMIIVLANACSSYSTEDYGESGVNKKESLCVNMEPAQEMKCKEREKSLIIGLGADKNCNHPYEYEKNRCKSEQVKKQKALEASLKKHSGK
jgi:hypothetical protein